MPDLVWQNSGIHSPARLWCVRAGLGLLLLLISTPAIAWSQTSVGIYSSPSGTVCSLSDPGAQMIEAYVVVRPDAGGSSGLEFAAPKPDCFAATYMGDVEAPSTLVIGNSQTGASIALTGCRVDPTHVLTIQYFGTGTTPTCCAYPVIPDPAVTDIINVDCQFAEHAAVAVASHVNPDVTCECGGNSPPSQPDQPDPVSGALSVSTRTSLSWFALDIDNNLAEYDVYLGTDPSPPQVATVSEMTYTPPVPLTELSTYYWRVVARDAGGLETSGNPWTFTTRAANSPPDPPFAEYPTSGAVWQPLDLTLGWQGADIDGDTLVYDVYFGTDAVPPFVASNVGTNEYTPPSLSYDTQYYWHIVARDPLGLEQSGPTWTFTTKPANSPPNAPSNPSPANSASFVPVAVTLSWSATDVDGDTLVFDVYFGIVANPPLLAANVTVNQFTPPAIDYGYRYYWRIVARDPPGLEQSGPVWTFVTRPANSPPRLPSNPSPPDHSLAVPINVTLSWSASDPDGDALTYDVYFGDTASPPVVATGITQKSYQPPTLVEGANYYWYVVARDQSASTPGPLWTFRTVGPNLPPVVPSLPIPDDAADSVAVATTLHWWCSDPNGNPLRYDIYFGTTSPPPLVVSNFTDRTWDPPGLLAFSQQYYWKIVARDVPYGLTTAGPEWTFTTGVNSAPYAPSNPVPADNGLASTNPLLAWSGYDPDLQPLTYHVYFGDTPTPPSVATVTSLSYYPGTLQEGDYYWRVVADDGEYTTSGPLWKFTVSPSTGNGESRVEIYADQSASSCSLSDAAVGPLDVYVFLRPGGGATGLEFSAPKPACFTGVYLGESVETGFLSIGNSQDGISIALTSCRADDLVRIMKVSYGGMGTTLPCCQYPVLPAPSKSDIIVVDCFFSELACTGLSLTINEQPECPCGALMPVLFSRFDASAIDEGVEVRWALSGDEVATQYTLLRRTDADLRPSVVGEGMLSGTDGSWLDTSVEPATTYHYELLVRTADGNEFRSPVATVTTPTRELMLGQNHPNPFNPVTVIPYVLPGGSSAIRVRLLILDVSGGVVRTLVNEEKSGGPHEAVWDGRDDRGGPVSSGIYFYVLDADGKRRTRKLVLLK